MKRSVRIGARGSDLSRVQALSVGAILNENGFEPEYTWIRNTGDIDTKSPLFNTGEGVFVDAINESLLKGEIDIGVHSAKDLPSIYSEDLEISYVSRRGELRDTLVSATDVNGLPAGSVVGTSSLRRKFQLLEMRPDLQIENLRGNIGTRISKVNAGYNGIIMALVAIQRLKLKVENHPFSESELVPSPNQGYIIGMSRKGDEFDFLKELNANDRKVMELERFSMEFLGFGCSKPIGILIKNQGSKFKIILRLYNEAGKRIADVEEEFDGRDSLKQILSTIRGSQ